MLLRFSLSLTLGILIMMCLGVGLFASILFGILCASWTCMSISFTKLGKISFNIFSNRFPISCSFSFPLASLWSKCWSVKVVPQAAYTILIFFGLFLFLMFWLVVFASLCSKSLIWFLASSTLLVLPCKLFCILISVSFVPNWIFFMLSRSSLHPYNQCFGLCIW